MIFTARFGAAQTGLGFQFWDVDGALLGDRSTSGIVSLPEAGAYLVDVDPPDGAVGIYWDSDDAEASEEIDRLKRIPGSGALLPVPDPSDSPDLVNVYVDTVLITGVACEGLTVTFRPASTPEVVDGVAVSAQPVSGKTDADGRLVIQLVAGVSYTAACEALFGSAGLAFTPVSDPYSLTLAVA